MDSKIKKLKIYTDGGARGNPGPAACGAVIKDEAGRILGKFSKYLGETTNNQAEYQGVILALAEAAKLGAGEIDFYLDSELVVNQLSQNYKVKDLGLQSLFVKVWNASRNFKKITYRHVPREMNKEADRLVNGELDKN
ncbi:MAG TPA: ribonuclease HI family protein [Patescibacteria group bacterium]|nr:ribonuclease HI family protein [Patescibacteria group bacterium]